MYAFIYEVIKIFNLEINITNSSKKNNLKEHIGR